MKAANQQIGGNHSNIQSFGDGCANIEMLSASARDIIDVLHSEEYSTKLDENPIDDDLCEPLESLNVIAEKLAATKAANISEIASKVFVWKSLTDDDVLAPDTGPADERLLLSIVEDVECLAMQPKTAQG